MNDLESLNQLNTNDYDAMMAVYGKYTMLELMQMAHRGRKNSKSETKSERLHKSTSDLLTQVDSLLASMGVVSGDGWKQAALIAASYADYLRRELNELKE